MLGEEEEYIVLVAKPEGKRRLGRHRCRWEVIIKIELIYIYIGLGDGLDSSSGPWLTQ
jgi:hypothetical protein